MRWAVLLCMAAVANGSALTRVQEQGQASLWLDRLAGEPFAVKLSETLTLAIQVEGEAPLVVELPKGQSTASWHLEALGKPKLTPLDAGKRMRWEQLFLAKPQQAGTQPLQMPGLQFSENDGPDQVVKWEPLQLLVTTRVAKVDVSEARDRTGIEELPALPPPAPPWWPWLLVGVPVVVVLAVALWRWRGRPVVELAAHDAAVKELAEVSQLPLGSAEEVQRFYLNLSDVLRRYLEKQLGVRATRQTTPEFFKALAQLSPLDATQQVLLNGLLRQCDVAKFAGLESAKEECEGLAATAREFLDQMQPRRAGGRKPSEEAAATSPDV